MTDIVEFLTARLDEDEAETLSSSPDGEAESWEVEQTPRISDIDVYTVDGRPICDRAQMAAAHIARHDPAHVLAEVKAKRALMALHQPEQVEYLDGDGQDRMSTDCTTCDTCGCADTWPCDTLKLLAAPYDQHPDYKQAWAVER